MIEAPKVYLSELLSKNIREDGRKLLDYRKIEIDVNPIPRANGSARVKFGNTDVIVGVKIDVGEPFPDTPEKGILIVNAELSPLASPDFEPGPPSVNAIELARIIDRAIRESKVIEFDKLCIKAKEKVWMVFIDVYPMNDDGNLYDVAALGAVIALKNAVFPKYNAKEDIVEHKELTKEKLPLTNMPILCTFGKINGSIIVDMTLREFRVMDARLSIGTLEDGTICAMQKGGEGTFTPKEILTLISTAKKISKDLRKHIK